MPRFHLNLVEHDVVADEEGVELRDLSQAVLSAQAAGREVIAHAVLTGEPVNLSHRIEIRDGSGTLLSTIAFTDLVRFVT